MKNLIFAILFAAIFSTAIAAQSKTGSVCVAKIIPNTFGEPNMGVPGNSGEGNKVRIGGKIVVRSSEKGTKIDGLSLKKTHLVKIYQDEKLVHSFKFGFADFQSAKLCLFTKTNYHTWQLWDIQRVASCGCAK